MLVMVCWFSILLVACKKQGIITTPGDDKPVEKVMQPVAFDDSALQKEIADLKAQISTLMDENGQLKSAQSQSVALRNKLADENKLLRDENSQLKFVRKDIEAENSRLADENKALRDQNEYLRRQNVALQFCPTGS